MKTVQCRTQPCETCPYRKDVPSGIWAEHEYAKLPEYDNPTGDQPPMAFFCHTSPDFLCNGWAICHGREPKRGHELLSLRILASLGKADIAEIPAPVVPLFSSGAEAAEHGMKLLDKPPLKALIAQRKIRRVRARKGRPVE